MEYDCDTLRIEYVVSIEQEEPVERWVSPSLWINDECISEGLTVDIRALVASLKGPGQYDILTCSCGEAFCAGIWEGIIVIHWPDTIRWLIPDPLVEPVELDEGEKKRILRFRDRHFRKADYFRAITSAVEGAKRLILQDVDSARTVPYGFSVQELLDIRFV